MGLFFRSGKYSIILATLLILIPKLSFASFRQSHCSDVVERGHLNVLTINLLYPEIENRIIRLKKITNFIMQEKLSGEAVDVILLQEVVRGPLSGTINSSLDLLKLLKEDGMKYNLRNDLVNGVPGIFTVGNAILSRCEILFTIFKRLPFVSEEPIENFKIFLKRKVMMSRINIEDFGKINVYNTHLCSFCDPITERLEQTEILLHFLENVEDSIQGGNPIILGGDFNINLNVPNDLKAYTLITKNFIDTYSTFNECANCCSEIEDEAGCTFAVQGNPFAVNLFTREQKERERIDYIFTKGMEVEDSLVVFNIDPDWVSDHSGVLTRIRIP